MTLSPSSSSMDELLACDIEVDDLNVELNSTPNDMEGSASKASSRSSSRSKLSSNSDESGGGGYMNHRVMSEASLVKVVLSKSDASLTIVDKECGKNVAESMIPSSSDDSYDESQAGESMIAPLATNNSNNDEDGKVIEAAPIKASTALKLLPDLDKATSAEQEQQHLEQSDLTKERQHNRLHTWNERFRQNPWQGMWKNKSPLKLAQEHLASNRDARASIDGKMIEKVVDKEEGNHESSIPTTSTVDREIKDCPYTNAMGINMDKTNIIESRLSNESVKKQEQRVSPTNVASRLKRGASSFNYQSLGQKSKQSSSASPDFFPVKPYDAYPGQFQMSESELYQEVIKPTRRVEVLKSRGLTHGKQIGSLKVEVLSCMGLAKFDRFSKPNAVAYLVCGDCAFATDVIPSSLSPMWPAGCKRAAVFPLYHAFARLYVGVFNQTEKDSDDFAGRVSINMASLCPDFEYDASFPLKVSTSIYDRRARGVIRLRFSLHWDSPSSAVLSYLPMTVKDAIPWLNDPAKANFMSIPCADMKTLKNVINVVHGQDLLGKFSRKAFKASTREMGLYKVNLKHFIRLKLNDIMTYRDPIFSVYVFTVWMVMVYLESVAFIPSFFFSCIFIIYLKNYKSMRSSLTESAEYRTLRLSDIVSMLFTGSSNVDLTTGVSSPNCMDLEAYQGLLSKSTTDVERDDLEFPFSDGRKYSRTSLREMMVPSQNQKSQKATRSSGAYRQSSEINVNGNEMDDLNQTIALQRPLGPTQDNDDGEKEGNVFKRNCEELERRLHSITGNVFHQFVSRPLTSSGNVIVNPIKEIPEPAAKFTNPLAALTASFLEPLMKAMGVYLVFVRAAFNIFAWKDPYFSFWALVFLGFLTVVLAFFPWQLFFFASGVVCFGPQNYVLSAMITKKKYMKSEEYGCEKNGKETQNTSSLGQQKVSFGQKKMDEKESSMPGIQDVCIFTGGKALAPAKPLEGDLHEVIVPYQRFSTERFYSWPPQPPTSESDGIINAVTKKNT